MAQTVKKLSAMWEIWVQYLGWEDLLEKGKAAHSSILAWRIAWTIYIVHGVAKSWTQLSDFHFHFNILKDLLIDCGGHNFGSLPEMTL